MNQQAEFRSARWTLQCHGTLKHKRIYSIMTVYFKSRTRKPISHLLVRPSIRHNCQNSAFFVLSLPPKYLTGPLLHCPCPALRGYVYLVSGPVLFSFNGQTRLIVKDCFPGIGWWYDFEFCSQLVLQFDVNSICFDEAINEANMKCTGQIDADDAVIQG